jgi:hypothetical protein
MAKGKNVVTFIGLFLTGAILANAQSGTDWMVSKGVQHVANKKTFEAEKLRNSHVEAKTVAFPSIVVSKGVARTDETVAEGNIKSKGYPTWAISKGVARKNQEMDRRNTDEKEFPNKNISNDSQPITKK